MKVASAWDRVDHGSPVSRLIDTLSAKGFWGRKYKPRLENHVHFVGILPNA